ncbi:MAG TPA: orotidine-5'-phosphate decarboxylase [Fimbriimonadaceae bacterium]|nr:orotidine-5'-phosphate decarboxylase [Fimbriimonadaceae bacterium]
MVRQLICALDTDDLEEALRIIRRVSAHVGAFKIGHGLALPYGLEVVERLRDAGANRIFLDLKLHDAPDVVAAAVREAARWGVWMMTLHISGGPAMIQAAVEEANQVNIERRPLLIGISVLSSIDQRTLSNRLGITGGLTDYVVRLSRLGMDYELDGVTCPPAEVGVVRAAIGHGIIVCRGIRPTGDAVEAGEGGTPLLEGANYIILGRALVDSPDPSAVLSSFGLGRLGGSVHA